MSYEPVSGCGGRSRTCKGWGMNPACGPHSPRRDGRRPGSRTQRCPGSKPGGTPRALPSKVPCTSVELVPHGVNGQRSPPSQQGSCRGELRFGRGSHRTRSGGSLGVRTRHFRFKRPVPRHRCVRPVKTWRRLERACLWADVVPGTLPLRDGAIDGTRTRFLRRDRPASRPTSTSTA